jgi:hypothetical protein
MKKIILLQLLQNLKSNPKAKKRIAIFLGVSGLFVILLSVLVIWGTVKTVSAVAQNISLEEPLQSLQNIQASKDPLLKPGCLDRLVSFLSLKVWLETPLNSNVEQIKTACFAQKPDPTI